MESIITSLSKIQLEIHQFEAKKLVSDADKTTQLLTNIDTKINNIRNDLLILHTKLQTQGNEDTKMSETIAKLSDNELNQLIDDVSSDNKDIDATNMSDDMLAPVQSIRS